MITFAKPEYLHLLWLLPLFVALLFTYIMWRKNALNKLADERLLPNLLPNFRSKAFLRTAIYAILGFVLLSISLADPQRGGAKQTATRKGLDIVVALDVSKSMDAQDVKPSRLAQAKFYIEKLLERLPQDRVGLVVFAGRAYTQMPLTADFSVMPLFLNTISTDMMPSQGTALAAAIAQAQQLLLPEGATPTQSGKVIILISDGENHEPGADEAAKQASEAGITIFTIGAGTTAGAPIPFYNNGKIAGFMQDENGNTVVSKINALMLAQLAGETNGSYFNIFQGVAGVENALAKLQRSGREVKVFDASQSLYMWFAAAAFALFLLEPITSVYRFYRK